jgi:hypothetical protein
MGGRGGSAATVQAAPGATTPASASAARRNQEEAQSIVDSLNNSAAVTVSLSETIRPAGVEAALRENAEKARRQRDWEAHADNLEAAASSYTYLQAHANDFVNSKLTSSQKSAVLDYTGSDYHALNRYLRTGQHDEFSSATTRARIEKHAKNLPPAINKFPATDKEIVTFRGIRYQELADLHKAGGTKGFYLSDKSVQSTSSRYSTAMSFSGAPYSPAGVVARLVIPKGTKGVAVLHQHSNNPGEQEILLAPGKAWRAVSQKVRKTPQGDVKEITFIPAKARNS